jgi:Holliday junction resolvasome RuvABC DNA-binding subunit
MISKIVGRLESIRDEYIVVGINGIYYQVYLPSG